MKSFLLRSGRASVAIVAALCAVLGAAPGIAQEGATQPASEQQDLSKKLANPISDLVSVPFQYNWIEGNGSDGKGQRTVLNIQPVVPFSLSKDWNLIGRWIMPYVSQPESLGSTSGFGDIVFSSFFSPATESSLTWGIGPVISLPMTTDPALGSGKWSAGPTVVIVNIQGPWVSGMLANQLWSFADASSAHRAAVNQAFLQPFLAYITKGGITYTLSSETTANWNAHPASDQWTVPINFLVTKLTKFGPFPFSVQGGGGVYVVHPEAGPKWQLRVSFILLLPRTK